MCFKMMLLSFNICIILAMVDSGKIVFIDTPLKINDFNETMTSFKPTDQTSQVSSSNTDKREILKLGLLNATLNIDRSIGDQLMHDPTSDHNVIISPISISAAMALILLGARGETKTEVGKLFGFDESTLISTIDKNNQLFKNLGALLNNIQVNSGDISGTQVNLAKAIFIQNDYNITTNFKMIAKEFLNSELITVDFKLNGHQAQKTINQWVSNCTHGKINDIMPTIPLSDTKTIITSAVYFTGEWEYPFFTNFTRIKPFFVGSNNDGKKGSRQNKDVVYIPMMVGSNDVLYHKNDELEFKAIGLPYKGKKLITYFVLPNLNIDLRDLVAKMNGNTLKNITKNTRIAEATYFVPKMTLESFTNLRPVLQNLGINKIFDPSKADLSNMAPDPGSYISDILHKVEIVIDEVGTVAAASTVVTITRGGHLNFNINRPFLFFIHHVESDTVIFWSTVHKPTPYSTIPPPPNSFKKT